MIQDVKFLRPGQAISLLLRSGQTIQVGVNEVNGDRIICYTGKGLREMWKEDMDKEEKIKADKLKQVEEEEGIEPLIASGHIAVISLKDIEKILSRRGISLF